MDKNSLTEFPLEICELYELEQLNLSGNEIKIIPKEIAGLKNLKVFWCNNTGLEIIPDELTECRKLDTFGARGNKVKTLPNEFGQLKNLRWLTLENNRITTLPATFSELTKLIHLNLKNNCLEVFPIEIAKLKKLRYCFLNSNNIKLIETIHLIQTEFLTVLDINENPFPDEEVLTGSMVSKKKHNLTPAPSIENILKFNYSCSHTLRTAIKTMMYCTLTIMMTMIRIMRTGRIVWQQVILIQLMIALKSMIVRIFRYFYLNSRDTF